jgi:transporter family-2 protein
MDEISAAWLYPIIIVAGALQAWGPPMNGTLRNSLTNPWLASFVSFLPVVAFLSCVFLCLPRPLPTAEGLDAMPWWAPLGGLVGALAVIVGLLFVSRVGAGALAGLTITANILMSLMIDKYGWFGMEIHPLSGGRIAGAALMVSGIALISKF